jgi:hypothetical protein
MGYSGFLKTLTFSNYRKEQKRKKGDCAGDISSCRWFKPSPRHFHGLWHCLNTFKLDGFLSEHGRIIYAFEEFAKRQN